MLKLYPPPPGGEESPWATASHWRLEQTFFFFFFPAPFSIVGYSKIRISQYRKIRRGHKCFLTMEKGCHSPQQIVLHQCPMVHEAQWYGKGTEDRAAGTTAGRQGNNSNILMH